MSNLKTVITILFGSLLLILEKETSSVTFSNNQIFIFETYRTYIFFFHLRTKIKCVVQYTKWTSKQRVVIFCLRFKAILLAINIEVKQYYLLRYLYHAPATFFWLFSIAFSRTFCSLVFFFSCFFFARSANLVSQSFIG